MSETLRAQRGKSSCGIPIIVWTLRALALAFPEREAK